MDDIGEGEERVGAVTEILSSIHVVLQNANYRTWDIRAGSIPTIGFEDETVMGFVCVIDTPRRIVESWRDIETQLINRHASRFRDAGEKAWNVYSVFITEVKATGEERREVRWIEENLERTRKITATGVNSRGEIVKALLPIMPIIAKPLLNPEDAAQRLLRRIEIISPSIQDIVLDDKISPTEVIERLRGRG